MDISGLCASRGTQGWRVLSHSDINLGTVDHSDSNLVIACPSKERALTKEKTSLRGLHKGALMDILILDICKTKEDVGVPK